MYRPAPTLRERAGPLAAVLLLHVGIGYALLHLSGADVELARQADLAIFDIAAEPPPPPLPEPPPPPPSLTERTRVAEKPKQAEGAAAPPNIRSQATPVVVPEPRIVVPTPSPIVAAVVPGTGAAPTQGAAPMAGPGTGAGGVGTGTGSGGAGAGSGGGGAGGNVSGEARARLVSPALYGRDFSPAVRRRWPPGGAVFLILRVGSDGVPLSCRVARSFGDGPIDDETCRLAVAQLRFEPARDERGRPVADFVGYRQADIGRF